jgi:hypothetical protein
VDGRKSGLVTWYSVFLMNNKITYGSDGNKRKKKDCAFQNGNNQYRIIGFMKINYRKRLSGQINIEQVLQPGQINCGWKADIEQEGDMIGGILICRWFLKKRRCD